MKVFTMVKGEVDIVTDWVLYHGTLFGFDNLFIIDNYSEDGTFETLLQLKQKYNINITRLPNYKKKGEYMTYLLRTFGNKELVFPLDIDEFIVYFDKHTNQISCDKDAILKYIHSLPRLPFYKMNYINSKNFSNVGYTKATIECNYGKYADYGNHAKTFFHSDLFKGNIDHGNHYNQTNNYLLTDLCLIHFHQRNLEQIRKKVYNNVKGLGYNPFDLNVLKYLQNKGQSLPGYHHVAKQILMIEHKFKLDVDLKEKDDVSLDPFNSFILQLTSY